MQHEVVNVMHDAINDFQGSGEEVQFTIANVVVVVVAVAVVVVVVVVVVCLCLSMSAWDSKGDAGCNKWLLRQLQESPADYS